MMRPGPARAKETTLLDYRRTINAAMQALIDGTFACLDSAAETINARTGGSTSKGTLSKRMHGALCWTVEEVIALEDAAGRYPVTRMMARRLDARGVTAAACVYAASGAASKEAGEAVNAALAAGQSADAGDIAEAIQEAAEGEAAFRRLREALELQRREHR